MLTRLLLWPPGVPQLGLQDQRSQDGVEGPQQLAAGLCKQTAKERKSGRSQDGVEGSQQLAAGLCRTMKGATGKQVTEVWCDSAWGGEGGGTGRGGLCIVDWRRPPLRAEEGHRWAPGKRLTHAPHAR
jgi:hypothetical protein